MKPQIIVFVMLVVASVVAFVYEGIFISRKRRAIDAGPIQVTPKERERIPVGPIAGGVCLAADLALRVIRRKSG